jgi:membrane protease YdiL (CAAX protease family)
MTARNETEISNESLSKALALWEIVSVVTSALIAEWAIQTLAGGAKLIGAVPIFLAIGLMLYSHRVRHESLRDIGFRFDNFADAARMLILPTVVAVIVIVVLNWMLSAGAFSLRPFRPRLFLVPFWALFQQYGLQGFLNRRAQLVLGAGWKSALLVGVIFSLLHLPSPLLASLSLIGGFVWAWIYQQKPNLFALALSHSVVSWTLSLTIPSHLTDLLRVGFRYFR